MTLQSLDVRGQAAVRLTLPGGASCTLALHGGQLLSWIPAGGVERIYLSPDAIFDGKAAIRGGIPVCWPQFNQRGPLAKHGFARNLPWTLVAPDDEPAPEDTVVLRLADDAHSRAEWPHGFELRLSATLAPHSLRIALAVHNTGAQAWHFTAALHTYLRVDDVLQARLQGLQQAAVWDAVRDERSIEMQPELRFGDEFDRVYTAPADGLVLRQPTGTLRIAQSASCSETVVWNPGPALSRRLADLPDEGWRQMLCVEAAAIDRPVALEPGERWEGWQSLALA